MSTRLQWLLELHFAGQTFRWSTATATVSRRIPAVDYLYSLGVDPPEIEQSLDGIGSAPSERSTSIEVFFPRETSVARLLAEGFDPSYATAELSLWREGSYWEERRVMLVGHVSRMEYGGPDEPVTLTIVEGVLEDSSLISPPFSTDTTRWPSLPDGEEAFPLPMIVGAPGRYESGTGSFQYAPAVPACPIAEGGIPTLKTRVVFAGHHVVATSVQVFDDEAGEAAFSVDNTDTAIGEQVAEADIGGSDVDREGSTYYVALYGDGLAVGGEPIETVADACLWALSYTSLKIDRAAWSALQERTRGFKIATFIDSSCQPLDWIIQEVLPLVPVSLVTGPDGLAPVWWNLTPQPRDVVARFVVGKRGVSRAGRVRVHEGEIANFIRAEVGFDLRDEKPRVIVEVGADPDLDSEPPVLASLHAAVSQTRYGRREVRLESRATWDRTTAKNWAQWVLLHRALPRRSISLEVGSEWLWLPLGSVVSITDADLYWEGRYALLTGVRVDSEEALTLELTSFDQPLKAGPSTS